MEHLHMQVYLQDPGLVRGKGAVKIYRGGWLVSENLVHQNSPLEARALKFHVFA